MKEYKINLDKFEFDTLTEINFDDSTIEGAILAGIINQIKSQNNLDGKETV